MQLKILITLTILILTFHSNTFCKNIKSKYRSELKALTEKTITKLSTSNIKSEANSISVKTDQVFFGEKFNFNLAQAVALFKQTAKNLFLEKEIGMIDHCLDMITNNLGYQDQVLKSFWDKMSEIYEEQQAKSRLESNPLPASPQSASYSKLNNWKDTLINEFKHIIKYVNFEQRLKDVCSKLFSDTPRNFFDLLSVLSDQRFFGGKYLITNKNHQFMDSMYSTHRNSLPDNAFKNLNEVSAEYMQFNNDQLRDIMDKRSYVPPVGDAKKPSPYASKIDIDFSKIIVIYIIKNFLNHVSYFLL